MSRSPTFISETAWFYQNRGSIDLIVESRDEDGTMIAATTHTRIPFRKLFQSKYLIEAVERRRSAFTIATEKRKP